MEELLKRFQELKDTCKKYGYANFIMSYDAVTDCPKEDRQYSNDVQAYFEQKIMDITLGEEYLTLLEKLYEGREALPEIVRLDIEIEHKELEKVKKVPREELDKHIENYYRSYLAWEKARETLDYSEFLREFSELVDYNFKYLKWQETDTLKGYNILLNDMEEGYNREMYDEFFNRIEKELVPFVKEVLKKGKPYNEKLDTLKFDVNIQKRLTKIIADRMEYTDSVGCIRETIHPFTNWANNKDVRITTSYSEDLLFSNLYSVMHEIGHALFQLQMDDKYNDTNVFENVTCITHESQSRFYENYLGRSRAFIKFLYPVLKELYPKEFTDITEQDVYAYVNCVKAQYTRVEADELTYPLHVLIRYNCEKDLFDGKIGPDGMEKAFNSYMEKYLGICPSNMKQGVFQDMHWTSGFGYFPTYAVGSAYGAMFLEAIKEDIDIDGELEKGDFSKINAWLREKIHKYSGTRKNLEVVRSVCKKEFDPGIYIDYLKKKIGEIYGI